MHPTKQLLLNGEKLQAQYKRITDSIDVVVGERGNLLQFEVFMKDAMLILLAIEQVTYAERLAQIEPKLAQLKKQYAVEFEKESAEVNMNSEGLAAEAKKFIGKEPLVISDKIEGCIVRMMDSTQEQEDKNEAYYELKGHSNFFKNKLK